ncbi:MAG: hypothetical protein QOJ49_777 [Actinomycetota bacterium]|nr:hypothetical protein [Actinomycetota bacterium]
MDGRHRRGTTPKSPLTAAWGDPAVVLRCGVGAPPGLVATSEVLEIDGVEWFLADSAPGYRFSTVRRVAVVEVRVPASVPRAEATAPLTDLATVVRRYDPATP